MKKAVSQKWKPAGNPRNRDISSFPAVSISGKPLCGFHLVSTPGNWQPGDSTKFPELETVNPKLSPRFLKVETSQEISQVVSTSFHTWKQSIWGFHLVSLHSKLHGNLLYGFYEFFLWNLRIRTSLLIFHTLPRCFQTIIITLKVMKMTIGLKTSPFHILMSLPKAEVILELHLWSRDQQILQVRILNLFKRGLNEETKRLGWNVWKIYLHNRCTWSGIIEI